MFFFIIHFYNIHTYITGPNLNLLCIQQSYAAPVCENNAKLYLDAEHLEKGLNRWCKKCTFWQTLNTAQNF